MEFTCKELPYWEFNNEITIGSVKDYDNSIYGSMFYFIYCEGELFLYDYNIENILHKAALEDENDGENWELLKRLRIDNDKIYNYIWNKLFPEN